MVCVCDGKSNKSSNSCIREVKIHCPAMNTTTINDCKLLEDQNEIYLFFIILVESNKLEWRISKFQ